MSNIIKVHNSSLDANHGVAGASHDAVWHGGILITDIIILSESIWSSADNQCQVANAPYALDQLASNQRHSGTTLRNQ